MELNDVIILSHPRVGLDDGSDPQRMLAKIWFGVIRTPSGFVPSPATLPILSIPLSIRLVRDANQRVVEGANGWMETYCFNCPFNTVYDYPMPTSPVYQRRS